MRIVPVILLVASRPCSAQQYDYGISEETGMPDYNQFFPVQKSPNDRFGLPALPDCVMTCGTGSTCDKPKCVCDSGYVEDDSLTTLTTFVCKATNECASSKTNSCDENATCVDTATSYRCECNPSYEGTGIVVNDKAGCTPVRIEEVTEPTDPNGESGSNGAGDPNADEPDEEDSNGGDDQTVFIDNEENNEDQPDGIDPNGSDMNDGGDQDNDQKDPNDPNNDDHHDGDMNDGDHNGGDFDGNYDGNVNGNFESDSPDLTQEILSSVLGFNFSSASDFCLVQNQNEYLQIVRSFFQTANTADLPGLLWHPEFTTFTCLDFFTIGVTLVRELKVEWCEDFFTLSNNARDLDGLTGIIHASLRLLIKILDEIEVSDQARAVQNFISKISTYLTTTIAPYLEPPINQYADVFSNGDVNEEVLALATSIIESLNLNNVTERNNNPALTQCSGIVDIIQGYYKQYESAIIGVHRIYRNSMLPNALYDSVGGQFSAGFSIVRHLVSHQDACTNFVDGILELAMDCWAEIGPKVTDLETVFNEGTSPADPILDAFDMKQEEIGTLFYNWLEQDTTTPMEQNAIAGWMMAATRSLLFFDLLPEVYYFLERNLRRDETAAIIFGVVQGFNIDMGNIGKRQVKVQDAIAEIGVCGVGAPNCEKMVELRQRYPAASDTSPIQSTFSLILLTLTLFAINA